MGCCHTRDPDCAVLLLLRQNLKQVHATGRFSLFVEIHPAGFSPAHPLPAKFIWVSVMMDNDEDRWVLSEHRRGSNKNLMPAIHDSFANTVLLEPSCLIPKPRPSVLYRQLYMHE